MVLSSGNTAIQRPIILEIASFSSYYKDRKSSQINETSPSCKWTDPVNLIYWSIKISQDGYYMWMRKNMQNVSKCKKSINKQVLQKNALRIGEWKKPLGPQGLRGNPEFEWH